MSKSKKPDLGIRNTIIIIMHVLQLSAETDCNLFETLNNIHFRQTILLGIGGQNHHHHRGSSVFIL